MNCIGSTLLIKLLLEKREQVKKELFGERKNITINEFDHKQGYLLGQFDFCNELLKELGYKDEEENNDTTRNQEVEQPC